MFFFIWPQMEQHESLTILCFFFLTCGLFYLIGQIRRELMTKHFLPVASTVPFHNDDFFLHWCRVTFMPWEMLFINIQIKNFSNLSRMTSLRRFSAFLKVSINYSSVHLPVYPVNHKMYIIFRSVFLFSNFLIVATFIYFKKLYL